MNTNDKKISVKTVEEPTRRNKLWLVLAATVLLAIGLGFIFKDSLKTYTTIQETNNQQQTDQPLSEAAEKDLFYFADSTGATFVDPAEGTVQRVEYGDAELYPAGIPSNGPVLFYDGMEKALVNTITYKSNTFDGEIESSTLHLYEQGALRPLVTLAGDSAIIVDHAVNQAKTHAYYITQNNKANNENTATTYSLWRVNLLDSPTPELQVSDFLRPETSRTGLIHLGNPMLFTLTNGELEVGSTTTDGFIFKPLASKVTCDCEFEYPMPVSKDGNKILFEELTQSEDGTSGQFAYHIHSITAGVTERVDEPVPANTQWTWTYWANDGNSLFYDTSVFGKNQSFIPTAHHLIFPELTNIEIVRGTAGQDGTKVSVLGQSPSGEYLAFQQDGVVKFYNLNTQEVQASELKLQPSISSNESFGWVTQ